MYKKRHSVTTALRGRAPEDPELADADRLEQTSLCNSRKMDLFPSRPFQDSVHFENPILGNQGTPVESTVLIVVNVVRDAGFGKLILATASVLVIEFGATTIGHAGDFREPALNSSWEEPASSGSSQQYQSAPLTSPTVSDRFLPRGPQHGSCLRLPSVQSPCSSSSRHRGCGCQSPRQLWR